MAKNGRSDPGLFGSYKHYDSNGKRTGRSERNAFGNYTTYDSKGRKTGTSVRNAFGDYTHYDKNGHKTGKSTRGAFGSYTHYDKNGKATGKSTTGSLGSYNHTDDPEACYIATCVYGSYDCPEVRVLRSFRDNVLRKSAFGRGFIRFYYAVSPHVVRLFGKNRVFRKFWKSILDRIISRIKS